MGAGGGKKRYKLRIRGVGRAGTSTVFPQAVFALCDLDHQKLRRQTIRGTTALPVSVRAGRAVVFILYGAILADITCPKLHAVR